jgi:Y-X(10)_GDL-associated radical SAM protein
MKQPSPSPLDFPSRYITTEDYENARPIHAVWEVTLACDLKCQHCGSRAGKRRSGEMSTEECLTLIDQMGELGVRHVTLIGGEAYLRPDWLVLVRAIRKAGMECSLQTGGLHFDPAKIRSAAEAGLQAAGVSIDGLQPLHDRVRGVKGSFAAAVAALKHLHAHGITTTVNTQITASVMPQLREMMELFLALRVSHWQVQLTVAMGRAADHPELLLQPYELLEVMPLLADLYKEGAARGILLQPGNNIGYFGPYESLWRGIGDEKVHWMGCSAGRNGIGIEADGTIKGCPSLPTVSYASGNVRDLALKEIWQTSPQLDLTRMATNETLWGYCKTCYYADVCRAGCTWTTHSLFGRAGNNPYCHHRTLDLASRNLQERIIRIAPAPGLSFDHGRFELVLEPLGTREPSSTIRLPERQLPGEVKNGTPVDLVQIQQAQSTGLQPRERKKAPVLLSICRNCNRHINPNTVTCPHCRHDVTASAHAHKKHLEKAVIASRKVLKAMHRV